MIHSRLVRATLAHHRGGAVTNNFQYPLYSGVFDIDELDELSQRVVLFSRNRHNLFSLWDRDYSLTSNKTSPSKRGHDSSSLRERVKKLLGQHGHADAPDRVELITQPRVCGYVFNPVSFFVCYRDDVLHSVIAEINNTYDQTYSYVLDGRNRIADRGEHAVFETTKQFFVSPFIDDDVRYQWLFPRAYSRRLDVRMVLSREAKGGPFFAARLKSRKSRSNPILEITNRNLVAAALRYPLLPATISARIHLQAIRLRVLGLQYRRPRPDSSRDDRSELISLETHR